MVSFSFFFQVWSVRVDVLVLNHSGNILDCCCIAAIASLAHFRLTIWKNLDQYI